MMNSSLLTPSSSSSSHIQPPSTFDHEDFLDHIFSSSPWPSVVEDLHLPPPSDGFQSHDLESSRSQQILMMPLSSHHQNDVVDGSSVNALYSSFSAAGSLPFHIPQGSGSGLMKQQGQTQTQTQVSASTTTGGTVAVAPQNRTKVRARRGQATDPHSIAERLRRERIAERMKALQELVPNGNKTDKASMLDEIIDYVKFLQLQVKVLSMSRLGGAASVSSQISEGGSGSHENVSSGGIQSAGNSNDSLTMTEHQVAKLMEEDMGSAMQYLQGKGLCLMPISLATAISTATCHSRNPLIPGVADVGGVTSSSPNISGLTIQSMNKATTTTSMLVNGNAVKDGVPVSKP